MKSRTLMFVIVAGLSAGCAAAPPGARAFGPDDPMNPTAVEAPLPAMSETLRIDTAAAAERSAEQPGPAGGHDHSGHGGDR